ncbi:MAG: polysaccharide deacetylase family protein [Candidatus Aenigmatarchaeota archaeon]
MVSICFYLHVHQPIRLKRFTFFDIGKDIDYFDKERNKLYLERVIEKSYLPTNKIILDLIHKTDGRFKISFSITGTLLEQLEEYPHVIETFEKIIKTGCAELVGETYYHSLASIYSLKEFVAQIKLHEKKLKEIFGKRPKIFRNTELIYQNQIGKIVESLGYKAILAEGADKILEWRSPCFLYKAKDANIILLLKHYRLSDDIAFRFSDRSWQEWPLTTEKYTNWISQIQGDIVNIFMDYETFGEHQWKETGIFDFLEEFPIEALKRGIDFVLPSEAIKKFKPVADLDFPNYVSWADTERDLTAWIGNKMQQFAFNELYSLEHAILATKDKNIIDAWRKLQTADHFYYMCTKWFADGDVHKYFNPYDSPYEAFIIFMNIINDIKQRIKNRLDMKKEEALRILSDYTDVFWCHDGKVFKNLYELRDGLRNMSNETYSYHANEEKNDFSNWVRDVIKDEKLANNLRKAKSKEEALQIVEKRIKELEKKVGRGIL